MTSRPWKLTGQISFIKKPLAVCQKILKNKIWAPVIKFRNPPSRNAESPIRVT